MINARNSLHIQVVSSLHMLRWEWQGLLSFDRFKASFEHLLSVSREQHITHWLADVNSFPLVGTDEQAWLSEVWLPRFARLRLRNVALLQPNNIHNQLVVENVLGDCRRRATTDVQFFNDIPAALDWLSGSESIAEQLMQEWEASAGAARRMGHVSYLWK